MTYSYAFWSKTEVATLLDAWTMGGMKAARIAMPHRSRAGIRNKINELGAGGSGLHVDRAWVKSAVKGSDKMLAAIAGLRPVECAARLPLTFEEQLAAVSRGARLVAAFIPRRPDYEFTLGGVSSI